MRPLNEIFGDLNSKLTTMSQGEQTQVLNKIFNKVDLKAVNALLANSGERFNQLSGAIEQSSGAAANMAETMNDNLKGKITILGSSLEGLGIQVYEKMEKPLKKGVETAIEAVGTLADRLSNGDLSGSVDKLAENFGNLVGTLAELISAVLPKLIDGLNWLMDNGPIITTIIAGFAGSFAVLKTAIAVEKIVNFAKGLNSLKSGLNLATISTKLFNSALLANPIVLIVTLIGGLVAALVWLWNTNEDFRNFWIGVWENIKEGFINCWNDICNFFTETIPGWIESLKEWFAGLPEWFAQLGESIKQFFIEKWNSISNFFTETIPQAFDNMIQGIIDWKNNVIQYFMDMYDNVIESIVAWKDGIVQYFKDMYNDTKQRIVDWANGIKESFIQWKNDTISMVKGWGQNISDFFTKTIPEWINSIVEWFGELPYRIGYKLGEITAKIYSWGQEVWNFFTETIPAWIESIGQWFSELPGKIANWLSETYDKFIEWKDETKELIKQWFVDSINSFTQWVSDTYDKFIQWKEDTKEAIKQWAADMVTAFSDWISETYDKVSTWASNMCNKAIEMASNFIDLIIERFKQLPGRIWEWLKEAYNKVSTWASNMCNKAIEMASNFIDSIIGWFKQLPGRMWNWLVNAYYKVVNWGKDLWNAACDAGRDLMNGIINTIKDLPNRMLSIGKDIVRGLWEGIKSMGSWLLDGVTGFVGNIVDGFKAGLGIHSPSRVMKKEVGRWIPPGISEGIEDEMPDLQKDINTNIADLTSKMKMTVNYETAHTASRITSNTSNDVINRRLENKDNEEKIPVNLTIVNKNYLDSEEIAEYTTPMVIDNINDDQQSYIIAQGGHA